MNVARQIPATAGIGLRLCHLPAVATEDVNASWVEIHSETFLCAGGPRLAMLDAVAVRHPLSCHGVGLSLGTAEGLDRDHLKRLSALFGRARPGLISEHLAWSVTDGVYLNDLLPLPYTPATLDVVCRNVDRAQDSLGRILVENPSAYLNFPASTLDEPDFLNALVARTGCGLLLDINNVYVTCTNMGSDARGYLNAIDMSAVGEIHLAGHAVQRRGNDPVLIDTHNDRVCDAVWDLYADVLARTGPRPTLIERLREWWRS